VIGSGAYPYPELWPDQPAPPNNRVFYPAFVAHLKDVQRLGIREPEIGEELVELLKLLRVELQ
jgi:hypothetical protein